MNNQPSIKLGIIVGSTDWLPMELAEKTRADLVSEFRDIYDDDIYECPICITDNEVSVKRCMKDLAKAECEAVCLLYANYGPESTGSLLANEFNGPVMLLALAEEESSNYRDRRDALSGFINALYALELRNANVYIPECPVISIRGCITAIHRFIPIARSVIALRKLKVISFGPRPSSYLASYAPFHQLYDLGIEISEYSEMELFNSFRKHDGDKRIEKVIAEITNELGGVEINADINNKISDMAQYEITIEDWIRGHKGSKSFVSLSSTCWPAFPVNFGFVPCYINSRLTGKGIPVSCEVDIFGAVSEYIGQCISNDITTILNINNNLPETVYLAQVQNREFNKKQYEFSDVFIGYHCGVTNSKKICKPRLKPHFVNEQLIGMENACGTLHGRINPGKVTLFRLQASKDGTLMAYVAQGQVLPVEIDTYGGYGVIAVPQMRRFIRHVIMEKHYPNHTALIFGHWGEELVSLLRLLGITNIEYNHPVETPYEHENLFETYNDWY